MAQEHNLAIFRGRLKFKSNVSKIWSVFILLSIITIVEVALGIIKPKFLTSHSFMALKFLNWIFIALTLVKAYYITWDFMHMRDEKKFLKRVVVWTLIFYIAYLVALVLNDGNYMFDGIFNGYVKYNF